MNMVRALRLSMVVAFAMACRSDSVSAPPRGFMYAAAAFQCGPADGPAVGIYLAPNPVESLEPSAPYVRVYVPVRVDQLTGHLWPISDGNTEAAAWFHPDDSSYELAATEKACAAARARAAARAAASGAHAAHGFVDAAEWLARATGSSTTEARAAIDTAVAADACPHTKAALVTGALSLTQAMEIVRVEAECPGVGNEVLVVALSGVREQAIVELPELSLSEGGQRRRGDAGGAAVDRERILFDHDANIVRVSAGEVLDGLDGPDADRALEVGKKVDPNRRVLRTVRRRWSGLSAEPRHRR